MTDRQYRAEDIVRLRNLSRGPDWLRLLGYLTQQDVESAKARYPQTLEALKKAIATELEAT